MLQILVLLLVPPMLIEFCLLRRGAKNKPLSILISAALNAVLWVFWHIACNWGIHIVDAESPNTSSERLIDGVIFFSVFFIFATVVSLIPAALFQVVYSQWRRSKHESAV